MGSASMCVISWSGRGLSFSRDEWDCDAAASISVVDDHIFATVDAVEEGTVFIGLCKYKLMQGVNVIIIFKLQN